MPELIAWTAGDSASAVEFTQDVMEEIRLRAIAGYKVLPRVGVGVGGLLLGERSESGVRITASSELPCSHRFGPGFVLDPHEKSDVRDRVLAAQPLEAVGWYFSRVRGEVDLTEDDRALARDLFGGRNPVTLIMKPAPDSPVQAAVYLPGRAGELERGSIRELESEAEGPGSSRALAVVDRPVRHVGLPVEHVPEPEVSGAPVAEPAVPPPIGEAAGEPEPAAQREPQVRKPQPIRAMPSFLPVAEEGFAASGRAPGEGNSRAWTRIITVAAALLVGLAAFGVQAIWLAEDPPNQVIQRAPAATGR